MLRRKVLPAVVLLLLAAAGAAAQKVTRVELQPGRQGLRFLVESTTLTPIAVTRPENYKLFEINAKKVEAPVKDLSHLVNTVKPNCRLVVGVCDLTSASLGAAIKLGETYVLVIEDFQPNGDRATFTFTPKAEGEVVGPLDPKQQNTEFQVASTVPIRPTPALKVTREVLVPVREVPADPTQPKSSTNPARPLSGSLYIMPRQEDVGVRGTVQHDPKTVTVKIDRLSDSRVHNLKVTGLETADAPAAPVEAAGKVEIGGPPSASTDAPRYSGTLSTNAGVGKKAVFDLRLNVAPRNTPPHLTSDGVWEPVLDANLGFRSTQSRKSVIFGAYYTQNFLGCLRPVVTLPDESADVAAALWERIKASRSGLTRPLSGDAPDESERPDCGGEPYPVEVSEILSDDELKALKAVFTPTYAGWKRTPWHRLSHAKFSIGPKFEVDQTLEKLNVIANARFDFFFHRWLGSVGFKRDLLINDLPGDRKALLGKMEGPRFGFRLVPYFSFDVGRRAYSETVTKKVKRNVNGEDVEVTTRAEVPEFGIARGTFGINNAIEWRTFSIPTTLTLDGSVIFLGLRESIGFTNDEGAFLKQLRGFHPRFVTALDFAIDPSRHYSFNITHENGRSAPNFEYLNKVTAGIKMTY